LLKALKPDIWKYKGLCFELCPSTFNSTVFPFFSIWSVNSSRGGVLF